MKKSKKITTLMAALSIFALSGCDLLDLSSITNFVKDFDVMDVVDPLHWIHDKNKEDDKDDVAVTSVVITPSALSLKEGESQQLSVQVLPSNATNKTVTWTSNNPDVATVDNGVVVAVKEGSTTIKATADGQEGQCVVTVTKESTPPAPVEIIEILSVNGPSEINQNAVVNTSDFTLTVKYSDGTTNTARPEEIILDTSVPGDAIVGTAKIAGITKQFTIKVVSTEIIPPVTDIITPQKAIELMEAAGEGVVVSGLQKVKGICAANTKYDAQYKQYTTGFEGVENFKLQFTDTNNILNGGSPDGMEIVVEGYLEKYQGKYQLSYLPAGSSPTGQKFTPNLVSASAVVHEGTLDSITVSETHREFYKGSTFVEETVTAHYSDGSTATVKGTFTGYDMATAGVQTVTVSYTEKEVTKQTTYQINVIERVSGHAGTLEDPLTTDEAVAIANGLAETTDSKNPIASAGYYIKGTVTEFKESFTPSFGNYSIVIGGNFTLWRISNGPEFTKFNEGDIELGDEVVAYVYIMNFKGTPESTSNSYVHSVQKVSDTKTLVSIEVVGELTKTEYIEGQTYSAEGLSAKAHFDDGSEAPISATITLNKTTAAVGDTEISATAAYGEKTSEPKTFTVTVTEKSSIKEGDFYKVKSQDEITEGEYLLVYEASETEAKVFNGIDVATKDGTSAVDAALEVDHIAANDSFVKIALEEMDGGFAVKVVGGANDGKYMAGQSGSNTTKFEATQQLNTITHDEDGDKIVSNTSTIMYNKAADQARFRYYKSGTTSQQPVHLYKMKGGTPTPVKELTSISIEGSLTQTTYTEGDAYSTAGLTVMGHYSDGSNAAVDATITLNKTTAAVGDTEIIASVEFNDLTATKNLEVTVNAKKIVTGITFSEEHRTFDLNAEFVKETVTATFTVGDPEIVDANFSTPDMSTAGEKTITVSYTDAYGTTVSDSYTINVVAPVAQLTEITIEGALEKTSYTVGEAYSAEGLSVVAHYDDGTTQTVAVTISLDKTIAADGDTAITASATLDGKNAEKDFQVTVINNATVEETITKDSLGVATSYGNFTGVLDTTGVLIGGNAMESSGGYIQIRDLAQGSGIYTRTSGRYIRSIEFEFDNANGKTISVYGQQEGYKGVPAEASGELLGTVTADGKITVTGDYLNILITSTGATYIKSIKLEWSATTISTSVTGVELNKTEVELGAGESVQLTAIVDGVNTRQLVNWETGDSSVATIENGLVTAVGSGTINVVAKAADDETVTATCVVKIVSTSTLAYTNFEGKSASHSAYNDSWSYGDFTITGGANNSAQWDYVKLGIKSKSSDPSVASSAINHTVAKVVVDIKSGSLSKNGMSVTEWGLIVKDSSGAQVDKVVSQTQITKDAASVTFTPTSGDTWAADCTYIVYFNCGNTSTGNGVVCLSGISIIG